MSSCILVGNKFANIMQIIVFFSASGMLFFHKILMEDGRLAWYHERWIDNKKNRWYNVNDKYVKPPTARTWKIWFLDNTKQGLSTFMSHIWGTYAAVKISGNNDNDQCGWFLLQYMIDTCVGVFLAIMFSKLTVVIVSHINFQFRITWMTIGKYGSNSNSREIFYKVWFFQMIHWLMCSLLARIFCSVILLIFQNQNDIFVNWFSSWWNNKHDELIFVILAIPMIFNTMQFIIQNLFLKWNKPMLEANSFLIND